MRIETPRQAADFLRRYGNVSSDVEQLLNTRPTDYDLRNAAFQAHQQVNAAIEIIRRHHNEQAQ